ncbi:MAG: FHA domain-containing protein [Anaerolineae bacterium]
MTMIEIYATSKSGISQRAQFVSEPFIIGSDSSANLCLSGGDIFGSHVRLLLTQDNEVLVTNLAPPNTALMDGKPLGTFKPSAWQPAQRLRIGDYELTLVLDGRAAARPSRHRSC